MTTTLTRPAGPVNAPPPAPPPRFVAVRPQGRIGFAWVGQIVALELAAILVVAALGRPVWVLGAAGGAALVLLALTFGRRRGDWWYRYLFQHSRFRQRRRDRAGQAQQPGIAGRPGIHEVEERGTRIGVGRDDSGFYAALELTADPDAAGSAQAGAPALRLDRLARVFTEAAVPISAVQVVSHVVPAPAPSLDARVPCVQSYRQLLDGMPLPAYQQGWLAIRLNPADAAAATASRGGGVAGVDRALAATVGRIGKSLKAAGVGYRVLGGAGLAAALGSVAGPAATPASAGDAEWWSAWHGVDGATVCFWLSGWERYPIAQIIAELGRVPATSMTFSVTLRPAALQRSNGAETVTVQALLRVAAHPQQIGATVRDLAQLAKKIGVGLRRLDGAHGPAAYASAPTAAEVE